MKKEIYLDNSATTKAYDEVTQVLIESVTDYYNPSAVYGNAVKISKKIEDVRKNILKSLNAKKGTVIFTSGGTESINTAILQNIRKDMSILSTTYEHDATMNLLDKLEMDGFQVVRIGPKDSGIRIEDILDQVDDKTGLVSVMQVNNELGHIIDVEALGRGIKRKNKRTLFHVDAVQSYMKMKIDVDKAMIDLLSISGHKIHGLKGSGALYVGQPERFKPLIYGGGQESGHRSGTENIAGILALGKAVEIGLENFDKNAEHLAGLRVQFLDSLKALDDWTLNSPLEGASHIANVSFLGVPSEILLHSLEAEGILVSSGSACSAKKKTSRSLEALGLSNERKKTALRFSFSHMNSAEEIDRAVEEVQLAVKKIRKITKYKR